MDTKTFIVARKLSLARALFNRFGCSWPTRCRAAGAHFTAKDFCSSTTWNDALDRLEKVARNYGFTCPLDDLGPAKEYEAILTEVFRQDLEKAQMLQDPIAAPTAGSLENPEGNPCGPLLPLAEAMAKAFNLPPIPLHKLPGTGDSTNTISHTRSTSPQDFALNRLIVAGYAPDSMDLRRQLEKAASPRGKKQKRKGSKSLRQKVLPRFKHLRKELAPAPTLAKAHTQ